MGGTATSLADERGANISRPTSRSLRDLDELREFLSSELSIRQGTVTLFAGAGISIPPPSNLPSASAVITELTNGLAADLRIQDHAPNLTPDVREAGVKMEEILGIAESHIRDRFHEVLQVFDGGSPNLYHHFAAALLKSGASSHIVTTNFDRLIEDAYGEGLHVFSTESEHDKRLKPALYKIHGSLGRPSSIVAVLKQVSQGLGPARRRLLADTLKKTCLVVGWSDNDIDLTPAFHDVEGGKLIWFFYQPHLELVYNFETSLAGNEESQIPTRVREILRQNRGIAVMCDPSKFFLMLWEGLKGVLGPIPRQEPPLNLAPEDIIAPWVRSLAPYERSMIAGDLLQQISQYNAAFSVFKTIEPQAATPSQHFQLHYRLGRCCTECYNWREAFRYFEMCISDKGYPGSIEDLLQSKPAEDPQLAVVYGNLGALLSKLGRVHDSVACLEMDVHLCEKFGLEGGSVACANLAGELKLLPDVDRAKEAAERAIAWGTREGNVIATCNGHIILAGIATTRGGFDDAEAELGMALELSEALGVPRQTIQTLKHCGETSCQRGNLQAARSYLTRALQLAEEHGLLELQAELWMSTGIVLKEVACLRYDFPDLPGAKEIKESLAAYEKALCVLPATQGTLRQKSMILNNRGLLFYMLRDFESALTDFWESLDIRTGLFDDIGRAAIMDNLAIVLICGGQTDEAEALLEESLAIYENFSHKIGCCQVWHDLGGVHMARLVIGKMEGARRDRLERLGAEAEACFRRSLQLAEELHLPTKIKQASHNLDVLGEIHQE